MNEKMKQALIDASLKHAEVFANDAVEFVYDLISIAVEQSETPIDDMFLPALNALKPIILNYVDKIDGVTEK